jgi:hypothetical protein
MDDLTERISGWLTMQAKEAGLPDGHLAESFKVASTG